MIVGQHFPSCFAHDNFTSRRTTGHNWYDPESLITGAEIKAGFTHTNSARNWANERHYHYAVSGVLTIDEIERTAPRRFFAKERYDCPAVQSLWEAQFV